jgi:uncharacterized membrane protein YozB (DUF420 family)
VSEHDLLKPGFLATAAPRYADVVLLLEIAMAIVLLLGGFLARVRKYRWHAFCQSAVVLLNLIVILMVMVPAFHPSVLSKLSESSVRTYYLLSSVHAFSGITAEAFALYILLAAGTKALPERLRFHNYKIWMRCALFLWWSALLLGIATYVRWYVL